jgi:hypothetical protein
VETLEHSQVETTLYSLADTPPAPFERRDDDRQLTLFRVGSLIIGDRRELCLIRNVSAGGMMIRAYCTIAPGTRVSVELKCGELVDGNAIWVKDDLIGLEFDKPIDVVDLLKTSMEGPRPRMPRIEVDCVVWVRDGADVQRARARNVSQGGLKVEIKRELGIGDQVIVTLPGLAPLPGTVRWCDSGCYGLTFNKIMPLPQLVDWLSEQRERLRATA